MLDDAALLHAVRLPDQVDWHLDRDRLVTSNAQEVDVDEPATKVVALDLPRHRQDGLAVEPQVDQHVRTGVRVQQMEELAGIHRQVLGLGAMAVDDGRNAAGRCWTPPPSRCGVSDAVAGLAGAASPAFGT